MEACKRELDQHVGALPEEVQKEKKKNIRKAVAFRKVMLLNNNQLVETAALQCGTRSRENMERIGSHVIFSFEGKVL